jgi:hypothetical protein
VHKRVCAAFVLCAPLLAGCGSAARLKFEGHNRPASPIDLSVYVGDGRVAFAPRRITAGPVELLVVNQSARAREVVVTLPDGRVAAKTPELEPGGSAQLKTTLTRRSYEVRILGRGSGSRLTVERPARSGNNELLQP